MKEWITKEEKELVDQLRLLVWDELPADERQKSKDDQDAYLLRWLRARELNLQKAEQMLLTNLKWRKEQNVDKVLQEGPDEFFKNTYKYAYVDGADYEGHPVIISNFYEWDFRLMINAGKADGFDRYAQYVMEDWVKKIREYSDKRKPGQPPITQWACVCDLSGYAYGQLFSIGAMKKWLSFAAAYEAYYPEIMFRGYVINCPKIFDVFLNLLKGVIAPRTLSKIICYPTMADWQKDIGKLMDPAILPEKFGGTSKYNPLNKSQDIVKGA